MHHIIVGDLMKTNSVTVLLTKDTTLGALEVFLAFLCALCTGSEHITLLHHFEDRLDVSPGYFSNLKSLYY